jgi:hypothetical protein
LVPTQLKIDDGDYSTFILKSCPKSFHTSANYGTSQCRRYSLPGTWLVFLHDLSQDGSLGPVDFTVVPGTRIQVLSVLEIMSKRKTFNVYLVNNVENVQRWSLVFLVFSLTLSGS